VEHKETSMKKKSRAAHLFFFLLPSFALFLVFIHVLGVRINISSSLPQRIWILHSIDETEKIQRGEYVLVSPKKLDVSRFPLKTAFKYIEKNNLPYLKQVLALPGDTVTDRGNILSQDSDGNLLPEFPVPYTLEKDEYWLTSHWERGFDSRYFGPVKRSDIFAKAEPIF
jgi:type IV secretory pathway protease TraF